MKICALTWNANGNKELPDFETDADLIILSLQECYRMPSIDGIKADFRFVETHSMFGLKTIIASREPFHVEFCKIGQGALRFINKGFIAAKINGRTMHINAHLAAHEHKNDRRMAQLKEIVEFVGKDIETLILSGDLNFRCTPNDQGEEFKRKYSDFKEAVINFKPTYKFKGNEYDKRRRPSFCDRVIVASCFAVDFREYRSIESVCDSDHKPVICEFSISQKKIKKFLFSGNKSSFYLKAVLTSFFVFLYEKRTVAALTLAFVITLIKGCSIYFAD